jgi:hypothetical protein
MLHHLEQRLNVLVMDGFSMAAKNGLQTPANLSFTLLSRKEIQPLEQRE